MIAREQVIQAGCRWRALHFLDGPWQSAHRGRDPHAFAAYAFTLQECREALALSQVTFATQLGVGLETYRTWDSGRRPARPEVIARANELTLRADPHALLPLETVAALIHVHRRTLQAAAKDGSLRVTYHTRTTFRRLRARATWADAETFRREYFDTAIWPSVRPAPLAWTQVPSNYSEQIRTTRQRLGLTQGCVCGPRGRRAEDRRVSVGISQALPLPRLLPADSSARDQRSRVVRH